MDNYKEKLRLGYRAPRTVLLPPYMIGNDYFVEFVEAIDTVFHPMVDDKIDALRKMRLMWLQNPHTEEKINAGDIIDFGDWDIPERGILAKQVNMLGMKLAKADMLKDENYLVISRFLGMYWFEKGTEAFIDFMSFCMNLPLGVKNMWTQDYKKFYTEGREEIGTPIWEGGTWYPTTHVRINVGAEDIPAGFDILSLPAFFYEISNYNLVLEALQIDYYMDVSDELGKKPAEIVALALDWRPEVTITNVFDQPGLPVRKYYY